MVELNNRKLILGDISIPVNTRGEMVIRNIVTSKTIFIIGCIAVYKSNG
jgi:hypothetical protein